MSESLKDQVLQLLRESRGKWPVIAEQSGVGYWWILKFIANKIPNPGFDKIERLHRYFTGPPPNDRDRTTADGSGAAGATICHGQMADVEAATSRNEQASEKDAA